MTAVENLCDVCRINPMIGVCSTSIPLSVAYCEECAARGADPELVFLCWEEDIPPNEHCDPDGCVTFKDGKYISYREWYDARHAA